MGIRRTFFADPSSPEYQNPFKLGEEMFKIDSLSEWESVLESDTTSVYFVTMAFLELLQKGSKARADFSSSVINITSCVAFNKFSNGFVRHPILIDVLVKR
jgi:NAD(P)-dependent dehydrogenase (short-subunit alcohol dehydrogenase family)